MIDHGSYDAAARRTADWAGGLLTDDGFRDCAPVVLAYYKAPVGLLHTGDARAAAGALRFIERRFYADGDFHAGTGDTTPAGGRSYRNGWLAWGAHLLGAFHLSEPTLDRLVAGLDARTGGAPDSDAVDPGQRVYAAGATASVANALMACGRVEPALRAARFLKDLYDAQAQEGSRVLLARDASGAPIDPVARGIKAGADALMFDLSQPAQICWIFGFSLRVFARAYRLTGEQGWLDTGERVGGWIRRAHESLYANITNGKVAWGAAEMYGATADPEWLRLVERIGAWVVGEQGADGIWVRRPQFASSQAQPLPISLDTSVERMFYMIDIPRALQLALPGR
ncbi:MAG: hypothetical protein U1E86_27695 [Burkholderiaceae bacterium]